MTWQTIAAGSFMAAAIVFLILSLLKRKWTPKPGSMYINLTPDLRGIGFLVCAILCAIMAATIYVSAKF